MDVKDIRQTIIFKASPHEVYEALMDSGKHSEFTGDKAVISRDVGGRFTAYGGYIEGENIELEADKKIVQKWRGSDWPEGHYSKVIFLLEKVKEGTKLTFTQKGVPAGQHKAISDGWHEHYWEKMKKMLEKP